MSSTLPSAPTGTPTSAPAGALAAAAGDRRRVYVRGAGTGIGRVVIDQLMAAAELDVVVAPDLAAAHPSAGPCEALVDVVLADHDLLGARGSSVTTAVAELLADAAALGVEDLVVVSSAMVYGAIANNPIPLTEDAVLRPDPSFVYARQLASAEAVIEAWRAAVPGRRVAVLRPAIPVAADGVSSLANALTAGLGHRFGEADPEAQFVHEADVASAVALAVRRRLDGVYNVAPDGSIPGERVRALTGRRMRLPLPDRLADVIGSLRWRFQRGPIPPGLRSYTRYPWIIANDKLRAEGWAPSVTNEQAYVEGTEAKWWTMITPKRRQEIALGAMVVAAVAAAAVATVTARRWWQRRRP